MGLLALLHIPTAAFLSINLTVVGVMLLMIVLPEAANTLYNPVEVSILAHQPIHPPTLIAARITHVLVIVLYLVPALTLPSAVSGLLLKDTRWIYPLTHFAAGLLLGVFVTFMICGLYGWLFRFVPAGRLKSVVLWLQALSFGIFPLMGMLIGTALESVRGLNPNLAGWSWLPPIWFLSIGLLGSRGAALSLSWLGLPALALTSAAIWLGLRGFSGRYLQESAGMIRQRSDRGKEKRRRHVLQPVVRLITGSQTGVAAFSFAGKMMLRDWQFRRTAIPLLIITALNFASYLKKGDALISPLLPGKFSTAHLIPHFLALVLANPCAMISFAEFHQGSWIFVTAPLERLGALTRGIYLSLWLPGALLPQLLVLPMMIWFWGWQAAVLFACFSLIVVSFYLALEMQLIPGLPFSSPYNARRSMIGFPVVLMGMAIAAVLVTVQWLVFQIWWVALVAGALLGLGAWATARLTLRNLEEKIRRNLWQLQMGPTQLFKEIE